MSFLLILLVLWVEKFSAWRPRIQRDGAWLGLLQRLQGSGLQGAPWLMLALLVGAPLLLLGLLLAVLEPLFYGWLSLPLQLLVLIYSLGRGDLQALLGPFRDAWRRGDAQGAYHVVERDLCLQPEEGPALLVQVQGYLLWQAFQSFFVVIFWFMLLGPLAALAYRLLALTAEQAEQAALRERAGQLRHAFDWLPARLLATSFALVGNFVAVSRALLHELLSWDISAAQLVAKAGRAAGEVGEAQLGEAGVATLDISLLVVHNISLPPGQFGTGQVQAFFQNRLPISAHPFFAEIGRMRVSAHFFIERDGRLTQFVSCLARAWHAGVSSFEGRENCNDFSLGVELEGTDDLPYSDAQYACLGELTRQLLQAYPQLSGERIRGHSDIAPGRKSDPGPAFDWARLRAAIE